VDPVPDPLLRKSGSAGNRTRTSRSVARNDFYANPFDICLYLTFTSQYFLSIFYVDEIQFSSIPILGHFLPRFAAVPFKSYWNPIALFVLRVFSMDLQSLELGQKFIALSNVERERSIA
jgi:hypothetical protein